MAEIKQFKDFRDYVQFNQVFIDSNPMLYYHLENTIDRVFKGKGRQPQLYKFFNIIGDNCFVAVLLIDNECLIYANSTNDEIVDKLSEGLEFHLFKRYQSFGTKKVIDALFQKQQVEYDEQKHRIIYECKIVASDFMYSPGKMSMAHLYQWNFENNICAIAQAIHNDYDFPVIGHVYTNPSFRGKGYAASIVHRGLPFFNLQGPVNRAYGSNNSAPTSTGAKVSRCTEFFREIQHTRLQFFRNANNSFKLHFGLFPRIF